jgi:hypothetical protein
MAKKVDFCGIYTGAKVDKFKECGFTKAESKEVSAPTLAECPLALECRVTDTVLMGTHRVFIADIVSVSCREDIIDEAGKLRFDRADLLAYAHGEYYRLGERLGAFGFSTDKKGDGKGAVRAKSEKQGKIPHRDSKIGGASGSVTDKIQEKALSKRDSSPTFKNSAKARKKPDGKAAGAKFGNKPKNGRGELTDKGAKRGRFSTFEKPKRS